MNELAKNLMCIQMRSGVEIWVEADRVRRLQDILAQITASKFVTFDEQTINTADVVGIFNAATMEKNTRRKNGQWECKSGKWHERLEKCACAPIADIQTAQRRETAYKNCGKCQNGYVHNSGKNTVVICSCQKDV